MPAIADKVRYTGTRQRSLPSGTDSAALDFADKVRSYASGVSL